MKFLPSMLPVLVVIATAMAPFVQTWMAAHPMAMTLAGALYAILTHLLQSPIAQTEKLPEGKP